jgi:hypothetical protein
VLVALKERLLPVTVCRCLRGASGSAFRNSSIAGLNGSSFEALGGSCFRGSGHADDIALMIVRRPTRYFFSIAQPDIPARASRRIAA